MGLPAGRVNGKTVSRHTVDRRTHPGLAAARDRAEGRFFLRCPCRPLSRSTLIANGSRSKLVGCLNDEGLPTTLHLNSHGGAPQSNLPLSSESAHTRSCPTSSCRGMQRVNAL